MNERSMERHWKLFAPTFLRLVTMGRRNPRVIAILATETFFRRWVDRLLELAAWAFLFMIHSGRAESISVGVGQIQTRHWLKERSRPRVLALFPALIRFLSVAENYDQCLRLVSADLEEALEILLCNYSGRVTKYQLEVYVWFSERTEESLAAIDGVGQLGSKNAVEHSPSNESLRRRTASVDR